MDSRAKQAETPDIIAAIKVARKAGLCVVPPREDGTKAPVSEWKRFQEERPTASELTAWYIDLRHTGIGYVTGRVSGIECFEFDDAGVYEAFKAAAADHDVSDLVDRVEQGYSDRSPSGGIHWYYRCDILEENKKLAERPGTEPGKRDVLIETRGEGGYVIAAPSYGTVHPSRKPYTALYGSPSTIATITVDERDTLFSLARMFDEMPVREASTTSPRSGAGGQRVGDVFNARASWRDILEPHGWTELYTRDGVTYWRRPGKDRGVSGTTNWKGHDALYVFTSSTAFEPDTGYHKITAYVTLNHAGDWGTAIKELAANGYEPEGDAGTRSGPAPSSTGGTVSHDAPGVHLLTRKASEIEAREIEWIWRPWLPRRMVALFAGYGGSGKSTVALSIAAACSVGGTLPDRQSAPILNTLLFAAEDSPEFTTIPRLRMMGADLDRISIVDGIARGDDSEPAWIRFQQHIAIVEEAVISDRVGLVVIDPVSSYIGDANGDKESDVRAGLMPLVRMSERTGAAVLMIRHVSKGGDNARAASRILGSTAWHDVPRVAWMLADAPQEHQPEPGEDGLRDTRRVLGVVKSNIAAKPAPRWCLQPVDGPLIWYPDPSPVSIDACFAPPADGGRGAKGERAEQWLRNFLKGGMKPSNEVYDAAHAEEITKATLRRTKDALKVHVMKIRDTWYWQLPTEPAGAEKEDAHNSQGGDQMSTFLADDTNEGAHAENVSTFPESSEDAHDSSHEHLPSEGPREKEGAHFHLIRANEHLPSLELPPTGTDGPPDWEVE